MQKRAACQTAKSPSGEESWDGALLGVEDRPLFRRLRVSNQLEQAQMVAMEAQWLDRETVLRKLPNISPEEVAGIMERSDGEDAERFGLGE